jgi:hypothetical protein
MRGNWIAVLVFLLLGSCSVSIVATRIHCEITGVEADCPHWVR